MKNTTKEVTRRIAANHVIENGCDLGRCVVELHDDIVINCHPLVEEHPMTEWFGRTIYVVEGRISEESITLN